jgi:two-component system chemotaxis response regulator CheY
MFDRSTVILVVDDAPAFRTLLIGMLSELGYSNFIEAADGNNAFTRLETAATPVGLILCDQNMPECNGIVFLNKIRAIEKYKRLPFIMITAEGEHQLIIEAINSGASNYVTKPVTAHVLKKKLQSTHSNIKK